MICNLYGQNNEVSKRLLEGKLFKKSLDKICHIIRHENILKLIIDFKIKRRKKNLKELGT